MLKQNVENTGLILTSKIINNTLTYNRLTPKDFPIEAKNIMHNINMRNGVNNKDPTTDTTVVTNAMVFTNCPRPLENKVKFHSRP